MNIISKQSIVYKRLKKLFFVLIYKLIKNRKLRDKKYYYCKWINDNDNDNLLFDYPLNQNSIIIDVGGYLGIFSDKIVSLYNPYVHIFEPIKNYYNILKKKYAGNKRVKIYNVGLASRNATLKIYLSGDGTSLIKKSVNSQAIKVEDVGIFVNKFKKIDLFSINIEGSEYQVLDRLIERKLIKKIKFIQVQFHNFVPNAKKKRLQIIKKLLETHNIKFSYPFVWESFELKN